MKVKCGTIYNGLQTIMDLSERTMPVVLAAKMLRLADDLSNENRLIEKQRQDIIEKYGDKDESGNLIISNGNVTFRDDEITAKAQSELDELANLEVEINDRGITEKLLDDSGLQLTISQLAVLRNFFDAE